MRHLLALLITLFLAQPALASGQMYVNAPSDHFLNLRTGPSTGYHVLQKMPHGSKVTVLARPGKWYKVRHQSGTTGWAHSRFLSHQPVHAPRPRAHQHHTETLYVDAPRYGALNLRAGPGTGYRIVRSMRHDSAVELLGHQGSWRLVRHQRSGAVGWAHGSYLSQARKPLPQLVPRGHRTEAPSPHSPQDRWARLIERCAALHAGDMQRCIARGLHRYQERRGYRGW
jgi:uncharacterized protein YgiM (DUF1202 family)